MIQIAPQMRILVAMEAVDFRNGIDGLARVCKQPRQNVIRCENGAISSLPTLGTPHRNPTIVFKTSAPTAFPRSIYKDGSSGEV